MMRTKYLHIAAILLALAGLGWNQSRFKARQQSTGLSVASPNVPASVSLVTIALGPMRACLSLKLVPFVGLTVWHSRLVHRPVPEASSGWVGGCIEFPGSDWLPQAQSTTQLLMCKGVAHVHRRQQQHAR